MLTPGAGEVFDGPFMEACVRVGGVDRVGNVLESDEAGFCMLGEIARVCRSLDCSLIGDIARLPTSDGLRGPFVNFRSSLELDCGVGEGAPRSCAGGLLFSELFRPLMWLLSLSEPVGDAAALLCSSLTTEFNNGL